MKVVHVNTYTSGGAAKAAIRQHLSLIKAGFDSRILFLRGNAEGIPYSICLNPKVSIFKRLLKKLKLYKGKNDRNEVLRKDIKGAYEIVSFPWSDYNIHELSCIKEADIINLHWVAGFIDYPSFFTIVKKPIVWTLHDMNPLLGLFHYSDDEKEMHQDSKHLNEHIKKEKIKLYKSVNSLHFVCPSQWLLDEVKVHKELWKFNAHRIPYSLDFTVFSSCDQVKARSEFQIPKEKKVLLFISDFISNRRKGFDLLIEALNSIDSGNIFLIGIGTFESADLQLRHPFKMMGKIEDEKTLARLYTAADAFLLPSRQDNLPNVMLEAFACGTPVISFKTGGMANEILHGQNGLLAEPIEASQLAKAIELFIRFNVKWSRAEIRKQAILKYAPEIQSSSFIKLYNQCCSEVHSD